MLGKIADGLSRSFQKETRNRADQPRQNRSNFQPNFFEAISKGFAGGFQSISKGSDDSPDGDTGGKNDSSQSDNIFLKISLILSREALRPLFL